MRSILFADPDRDLLTGCSELLRLDGYEVTSVFDGTQVIEKIEERPYDLAVLNASMPRIATERLTPLIHEKNTPVLILGTRKTGMDAEAELAFPFVPSELRAAVSTLLSTESEQKAGESR